MTTTTTTPSTGGDDDAKEGPPPPPLPPPASPSMTQAAMNHSRSDAGLTPLYKIVLTGGPCGGKTTALARLSSYLRERGFEVVTCPEAFSLLISNGMSGESIGSVGGMAHYVQSTVMDLQTSLEDGFERILKARGKPSVMLCDRGLMDGSAYMNSAEWDALLAERGIRSSCELREGRYNAVFHLVTAAEGASEHYTLDNNEARTESPEEAKILDEKTRSAWVGHPKLCVFDNSTDFEGKLRRLVDSAARLVGLPSKLERVTTKFLLKGKPELNRFPKDVKYHVFEVEKVYLYDDVRSSTNADAAADAAASSEDEKKSVVAADSSADDDLPSSPYAEEYSFVRKRTHVSKAGLSTSVYGQTTVKRTRGGGDDDEDGRTKRRGQVIEVKRIITGREYASAYRNRDPSRHVVKQTRISFLWKMQSFNVHIYNEPISDLCVLHAQVESSSSDDGDPGAAATTTAVDMPPFLDVERRIDVTPEDERKYGAFNISLIDNERRR